jgi:phage terminase large subunit-like protein
MVHTVKQNGKPAIAPQNGPQMDFCATGVDVAFYGGTAMSGKTFGQLLEASRFCRVPNYTGVIFRRQYTDIVGADGLWDKSEKIYPYIGGVGTRGRVTWEWEGGGTIKFAHLNHESDKLHHQGLAYVFLGFDELTHFSYTQFLYLMTRNRLPTGCTGVRPYCRATFNAEPGWIADMIAWYWDPETGYPIPERSGVVRWFTIVDDKIEWVEEGWRDENGNSPKAFTFIAAKMEDNQLGLRDNPDYKSTLQTQDRVTRERLLKSNFLITDAGNVFDPLWFKYAEPQDVPAGMRLVRYWDMAASEVEEKSKHDPDWTAGAKCGIHGDTLWILDITEFREKPGQSEINMANVASADGKLVEVWWEEEKGSSGKYVSKYMEQIFAGYEAHADPVSGSKVGRAKPWAAWAEFGRVRIVRGAWNKTFLAKAGKFPDGKRDSVDAVSGCFKVLVGEKKVLDRYVSDDRCIHTFGKELDDFEKIQIHNIEVYISLWAYRQGIYGGCYVWSVPNRRLRMYNEIFCDRGTPAEWAQVIKEAAVIPVEESVNRVSVFRIVGNEDIFNVGKDSIAKALRKAGIRVKQNILFDEVASIARANSMFSTNGIVLHSDCKETDVQLRGWIISKDNKPAEGYPMARQMLLLLNELKHTGKFQVNMGFPPYSSRKPEIRDKLKGIDNKRRLATTDPNKQYEYLLR